MIVTTASTTGLLLSGGLDSSILLSLLLEQGRRVQPFFIRSGLSWETCELSAIRRYLAAVATDCVQPLVILELPLHDLYGGHWSLTGEGVPDESAADQEVFLPGRNVLLTVKAAIWCQLHGIDQLAAASLGTSPFADATPEFFTALERVVGTARKDPFELSRPFAELDKRQVMQLGQHLPLELTFSCISPRAGGHCGRCNKCGERRRAFSAVPLTDLTPYDQPTETQCAAPPPARNPHERKKLAPRSQAFGAPTNEGDPHVSGQSRN